MPLALLLDLLLSFARQRQGCLPINRQCILAIEHTHQERNKREEESERGKVIPHNCEVFCEIVSEVFSPSNREISVVLLLLERGCNSHIT